jgi:hypothetical protein
MWAVMRATLCGLFTAFVVVLLVESIGHLIWPPPEGLAQLPREEQLIAMAKLPTGALVSVLVAWCAGLLGGGSVARLLSHGSRLPPAIVAGLLLAASAAMVVTIPHPGWFLVSALVSLTACTIFVLRPLAPSATAPENPAAGTSNP